MYLYRRVVGCVKAFAAFMKFCSKTGWLGEDNSNGAGEELGSAFCRLFLMMSRFWTRYDAYVRVLLLVIPRKMSTIDAPGSGNNSGN